MSKPKKKSESEMSNITEASVVVSPDSILIDYSWNARSGEWWTDESYCGDKDGNGGLKNSIKSDGQVISPLEVRPTTDDEKAATGKELFLIAGFRRLRAALELGFKSVPVIIKEYSPAAARLRNIQENSVRENLNVPDTAWALKDLGDSATQKEIGDKCNFHQTHVSRLLKLVKGLADDVFTAWRRCPVNVSIAEMLSIAELPKPEQMGKFAALVAAAAKGKGKGKGAWLESACKKSASLGMHVGMLVRKGLIGHVETSLGNFELNDVLLLGVKLSKDASEEDQWKIIESFIESVQRGAEGPPHETNEEVEEQPTA
jgi:ParB/RepB/Spo0J family partition protein